MPGDIDELVFLQNELIQDAVIRNLKTFGKASNNIQQHYLRLCSGLQDHLDGFETPSSLPSCPLI